MYARILVPLDGSDLAERVLPYVEALAKQFGSTVILLLATDLPRVLLTTGAAPGGTPLAVPVINPKPIVEGERRAAAGYLDAVAERLRAGGLTVECEQPNGPAAETIVEGARRLGADLIAMTTHGRGGLGRLVYGSVADAVLRSAPCPVLLVRVSEGAAS
jgi:nucleotide-binding universal stress UspA family protein